MRSLFYTGKCGTLTINGTRIGLILKISDKYLFRQIVDSQSNRRIQMTVDRQKLRWFTIVFGLLVLVSYVYGLSHAADKAALWGGVSATWQVGIVCCMGLAAVGFLTYWWISLFRWEEATISNMCWPWQTPDVHGMRRLLGAYALLLIPSALWLEATLYHMTQPSQWSPLLSIGTLTLAAAGAISLTLLAYGTWKQGVEEAKWMTIGGLMVCLQVVINDWIIWTLHFPW
jgi:hypothetical protein